MTEPSNLRDAAEVADLVEKPRPYPHATPGFNCSEYFGFDGGSITIRTVGERIGSGWLCFAEEELVWEADDETGKDYRICYLANSELIAIRDKLNEIFPADRIEALEAENERLRGALVGAAFEFDLIVQRIREGQPRRGEGIAVCSAIEARAALGEKQ